MSVNIILNGTTYEGVETVSIAGELFKHTREWTDIAPSMSTWTAETQNGTADITDAAITLTASSSGWFLNATSNPNSYTYSILYGKNVRLSFDYTLSGFTSGKGITGSMSTYSSFSAQASNRTRYVSDNDNKLYIDTNGSGSFTTVVSCDEIGMRKSNGSPLNSDYVGVSIFLNANAGAVATISNLKLEVQNL